MAKLTFAGRTLGLVAATLALLPLAACYTYAPASIESLSPGQTARVTLDRDGYGRVINEAATAGFPVQMMNISANGISGRVSDLRGDAITVELRGVGGSVFSADVASASIEEVSLRRFDGGRTLLAIAGGAVITAALIQGGVVGGSGGGNPDPPVNNMTPAPSLRIPFP